MDTKSLYFRDTLYVVVANALALLASFLTRPLVARFLGPDSYGAFALIFAYSTFLSSLLLWGINDALLYFSAKDPKRTGVFAGSALGFQVGVFVLFAAPLYWFALQTTTLDVVGFAVAYGLAFSISFFTLIQAAQQSLERFFLHSASRVASVVLAGIASVFAAYFFHQAAPTLLFRGASVVLVGLVCIGLLRLRLDFDFSALKKMWSYAAPLALAGAVISLISLVDRYVLSLYYPNREVAFYDAASSLASAILPFAVAGLITMMPKIIKESQNTGAYFRRLATLNVVFLSAFGLFLFYFADLLVHYLLGSAYVDGTVLPLRILAFSLPMVSFYYLNGSVLNGLAKVREASSLSVLLVLLSLATNFWLVPSLASSGAAWAYLISYGLVVLAGSLYLLSQVRVSFGPVLWQLALFAFFCGAYLLGIGLAGFVWKAAAFLVFGGLTLFLNRGLALELWTQGRLVFRKK